MSVSSRAIFILLSLVFVCLPSEQQPIVDNMCRIDTGILCVRDQLTIIKQLARDVIRTTIDIERHIKRTKVIDTLNQYVTVEMNFTHASLPSSHCHIHLFQRNNIDKEHLTRLLLEAHDAVLYFSNSIDDLRGLESMFAKTMDDEFGEVQKQLKEGMVCRYRSVLHVYSRSWTSVTELAGRMQFSEMEQLSPSHVHDVRSVVIARHLRRWMQSIVEALEIVERKLA